MNRLLLEDVDRLEIVNLMDNFTDILMAGAENVERAPFGRNEEMNLPPLTEHGFSIILKISTRGSEHTILVDTGVTPDGVLVNIDRMRIDLGPVEAIVLTHGHVDHTAGLLNILKRLSRKDLPLIVHPQAFRQRWAVFPDGTRIRLPTLSR